MPTTYAHYRLGQEVKKQVSAPIAEAIEEYPQLFDIGVHGPDLLFYYNALSKNKINATGAHLHQLAGRYFFERSAKILKEHEFEKAHLSYIYGVLCHFALDVSCHGYVGETEEDTGISHAELEAELDRELMVRDGKNPVSQMVTGHLKATWETAEVIKDFYPGLTTKEIQKSIHDMIFYLNILVAPGRLKRELIFDALKAAGKYKSMGGLIINREKNPACAESTERLLELYEDGKALAVRLIEEYALYLNGEKELDSIYAYNFESILVL